MDEQQGEVVIVDNDGHEHVFPAGFDPKRAAGIVQQRTYKPDPLALAGSRRVTSDTPDKQLMLGRGLGDMLQGAAHPETLGDVSSLLIPTGIGMGTTAIGEYANVGKRALAGGATLKKPAQLVGRMLGILKEDAFPPAVSDADKMLGRGGARPTPLLPQPAAPGRSFDPVEAMLASERQAPAVGTTPTTGAQGLSAADRAQVAQQGLSPDAIAKLEAQLGGATPLKGTLRMNPTNPPITVDPGSLPQSWRDLPHPLDPSRVEIGAEKTGRAAGMTKQEVRDVATPILGAEPGAASPILPEGALKKIVDTLKALPPGGPEREAYVAAATSGKAQWQIENIRRTLEHLGLIVPIAATGGAMFRNALIERLNGGPNTTPQP